MVCNICIRLLLQVSIVLIGTHHVIAAFIAEVVSIKEILHLPITLEFLKFADAFSNVLSRKLPAVTVEPANLSSLEPTVLPTAEDADITGMPARQMSGIADLVLVTESDGSFKAEIKDKRPSPGKSPLVSGETIVNADIIVR